MSDVQGPSPSPPLPSIPQVRDVVQLAKELKTTIQTFRSNIKEFQTNPSSADDPAMLQEFATNIKALSHLAGQACQQEML